MSVIAKIYTCKYLTLVMTVYIIQTEKSTHLLMAASVYCLVINPGQVCYLFCRNNQVKGDMWGYSQKAQRISAHH